MRKEGKEWELVERRIPVNVNREIYSHEATLITNRDNMSKNLTLT
jgi:hypothetical protein